MTKNTNNETNNENVLMALDAIYWTLNTLTDIWTNDTQALFNEFVAGGGFWEIPSLDETQAQFGEFIKFMRGKTYGA